MLNLNDDNTHVGGPSGGASHTLLEKSSAVDYAVDWGLPIDGNGQAMTNVASAAITGQVQAGYALITHQMSADAAVITHNVGADSATITNAVKAGSLDVTGNVIRIETKKTPASGTDTGVAGQICWDANYVYICTSASSWSRATLSLF